MFINPLKIIYPTHIKLPPFSKLVHISALFRPESLLNISIFAR